MWERGATNAKLRRRVQVVLAWLTIAVALVAASVEAASTQYIYDGKTTYCWQVDSSVYASAINTSSLVESSDDLCVVSLTVGVTTSRVYVNEPVRVTWNATVNLDSKSKLRKNKFGMEQLFTALDEPSQTKVQVISSRLHACTFGDECDPVTRADKILRNSTNAVANFIDFQAPFASSELVFPAVGSYAVIGHVILPGADAKKRRYEFAAFTKVDVIARPSETSTAPLAETQAGSQKSEGMKTEVLCVIIIGAIAGVSLIVIGFTTLRTKGKPLAATKKDFRNRFESNPGVPAVVVGGANDEDNFAMLSMHEMVMSSDRPRANTFLASLARGQAEKASRGTPVDYVGPLCQQNFQRNVIPGDSLSDASSDDCQPLTLETPQSSRDHAGDYTGMTKTPKPYEDDMHRLKPTSHIMFNDIQEDEVVDDQSPRRRPAADLTEVSQRIREHANQMLLELQEAEANSQRVVPKMTADDLNASVVVEKGPQLTLSDLGSVQHGLYRYSEDSNYD